MRRVVAGWVFVLVPVLALNMGYFVLAAPRIVATSWESAARFVGQIATAGGVQAVFAAVQLLLLLLPTIGLTYTAVRFARRGAAGAWSWSAGSAPRRAVVLTGGVALVVVLGFAWYPDGRLWPYRPGERGTVQQHVGELAVVGTGSPLLRSPSQAQQPLGPAPTGRSAPAPSGGSGQPTGQPTGPPAAPAPSGAAQTPAASAPASPRATPSASTRPSVAPTSIPTPAPTR